MKLRILAVAVAMASVSVAAQADVKISGDVGAAYYSATESIEQFGSEVNFDASEKVGAITYGGHMGLQYGESGASLNEGRVSAAGGFGTVTIGHNDNGCNTQDVGGDNSTMMTHTIGGCKGESDGNIVYTRAMGPASLGISHNPGAEETTFGVKGAMGPVGVSLGYEVLGDTTASTTTYACATGTLATDSDGDSFCTDGSAAAGTTASITTDGDTNVVLGLTGKVGPVSVGFRANKLGDADAVHGINALYSAGGHNIYGGLGTSEDNDTMSFGYKRVIGMTDFVVEAVDDGTDTNWAAGMRHRF